MTKCNFHLIIIDGDNNRSTESLQSSSTEIHRNKIDECIEWNSEWHAKTKKQKSKRRRVHNTVENEKRNRSPSEEQKKTSSLRRHLDMQNSGSNDIGRATNNFHRRNRFFFFDFSVRYFGAGTSGDFGQLLSKSRTKKNIDSTCALVCAYISFSRFFFFHHIKIIPG